jgi:hypothetical protein
VVFPVEQTEQQKKLDYLSRNFLLLNQEGKDYIEAVSRQLLYIQYPVIRPFPVQKTAQPQIREKGRDERHMTVPAPGYMVKNLTPEAGTGLRARSARNGAENPPEP